MDKVIKKPNSNFENKLYKTAQLTLLVATAVVTYYQIRETFFKKDENVG